MQSRDTEIKMIIGRIKCYPVTAIVGARQMGKTTLAYTWAAKWKETESYFDQEHPGEPMAVAQFGRDTVFMVSYRIFIGVQKRSPTLPGRIACALRYSFMRGFLCLCVS